MDRYSNGRESILFPARRSTGKLTSDCRSLEINDVALDVAENPEKIVVFFPRISWQEESQVLRSQFRDLLASALQKNHIAMKLKKVLLALRENSDVDRSVSLDTHPFE